MITLNEYLKAGTKLKAHDDPETSWNFLFYRSKNEDEYCAIINLVVLKDREVSQDIKRIQFRANDEYHDLYKQLVEKRCSPDFTETFLDSNLRYAIISKHDYDDEIEIRYIDKKNINTYIKIDIDTYYEPKYFDKISFENFLDYCHDECGFKIK